MRHNHFVSLILAISLTFVGCGGGSASPSVSAPQPSGGQNPPPSTPPPSNLGHYTVVDLPPLPGGGASQAQGVSSAGVIAGYSVSSSGHASAVLWTNGIPQDLGIPDSVANGVNASGVAVGRYNATDGIGEPQAFVWTAKDGVQAMGVLPGFDSSMALAINDAGMAIGLSFSFSNSANQAGFMWTKATGIQPAGDLLSALGLSPAGQVAGIDQGSHAAIFAHSSIADLGTLGGDSVATAVNSAGHAVGFSAGRSFFYDGTMHDLGLRDDWASATADGINDAGIVIGNGLSPLPGAPSGTGVSHPYVYTAAQGLLDLNTLIPSGSGWTLVTATGINAKGQISGLGQINGELHGLVLMPN